MTAGFESPEGAHGTPAQPDPPAGMGGAPAGMGGAPGGPPPLSPPRPPAPAGGYPATSSFPTTSGFSTTTGFPATAGFPAPAGFAATPAGPYAPGQPPVSGVPGPQSPAGPPGARRQRLASVATGLAVLLLAVTIVQSFFIVRLNQRVDSANQAAARARDDANVRLSGLESRAANLERGAGNTLDAAAVASAASPSVFRILVGQFSGTAFGLGKEPSGGGTDLVTNYHVIDSVGLGGTVALDRDNKRYTAKVTRVNAEKDIAIVHCDQRLPRLQAAAEAVKPGEPILVIGAPLGLADTVTTGVVSAVRDLGGTTAIQFDAPVNPGNSGGPVLNNQKLVVGVASAKLKNTEGIGLAVPIAVVCQTFGMC